MTETNPFGPPIQDDDPEAKKIEYRWKNKDAENRIAQAINVKYGVNTAVKPESAYTNVENFHDKNPFFYDKQQMFWFWTEQKSMYEYCDETTLLQMIESSYQMYGSTIGNALRSQYLNSFKLVGRRWVPMTPPKTWLQFGNQVFDYKSKKGMLADPDWFICNPIPWKLGTTNETPEMDKIITEWVGEKNLPLAYEILAYCCVPDYPLHTIFCFIGSGRNGKSKFLQLIKKFVGEHNVASTELDALAESRFESSKLYKKTVCLMGETDFGILKKTGKIKRMTGQDLIGYEFKNKMPFDAENYAKLIISSNSLPSSYDTSDGWYRRIIILEFPNEFGEGKDVLAQIPEVEYENLANKVVGIIPALIDRGSFTNQGSIEERKQKYQLASNPLPIFIQKYCDVGFHKDFVPMNDFNGKYHKYLLSIKRRLPSKSEIEHYMNLEGFYKDKITRNLPDGDLFSGYAYIGIKISDMTNLTFMTSSSLASREIPTIQKHSQNVINVIENSLHVKILAQIPPEGRDIYSLVSIFETIDCNIYDEIDRMKTIGLIYEISPGILRKV